MKKEKRIIKSLKKGRFYLIHDGSPPGHPSMILWKRDKKNLYLSIITGTSPNKDMIKLYFPTTIKIKKSFVHKRPFLGKRKDYGKKEMLDMKFNKKDKPLVKVIAKKRPRLSKNISRKDLSNYKRVKKKPYF